MQAPITWNDEVVPYSDPSNDLVRMFTVADPLGYALSKPLYAASGTVFDYCNASTNILGDVVRRATGRRLDHFADTVLFLPLGITTRRWYRFSDQAVLASGDLELRPRDAAKLGQLFLSRGGVGRTESGVGRVGGSGDGATHLAGPAVRLEGNAAGR